MRKEKYVDSVGVRTPYCPLPTLVIILTELFRLHFEIVFGKKGAIICDYLADSFFFFNCGSSVSYIALFVSDEHQTKATVVTVAATLHLFRWYSTIKSVQRQPIYTL